MKIKQKVILLYWNSLLMVLSIVSINAATKSKNHSWTTNYGGATETVKLTVDLSTINKPSVSYTKNGYRYFDKNIMKLAYDKNRKLF